MFVAQALIRNVSKPFQQSLPTCGAEVPWITYRAEGRSSPLKVFLTLPLDLVPDEGSDSVNSVITRTQTFK